MRWKQRVVRDALIAVLGGLIANIVYFGLLFTHLHGFAVKALGSAIYVVYHYITPHFPDLYSCRYVEFILEFTVNILLYAFWIFVFLTLIHLPRMLREHRTTTE